MAIDFTRLRSQFIDSTKFKQFLDAIFTPMDNLKTPIEDIRTKTDIENAVGGQIDLNGKDLGIDRNGLSDADYITLQKIKIDVNNSGGTVDELINIIEGLAALTTNDPSPPDPIPVDPVENFPAAFRLNLSTTIKSEFRGLVATLIRRSRFLGINGRVIHGGDPVDGSNRFLFDSGFQGFDGGGLFSEVI